LPPYKAGNNFRSINLVSHRRLETRFVFLGCILIFLVACYPDISIASPTSTPSPSTSIKPEKTFTPTIATTLTPFLPYTNTVIPSPSPTHTSTPLPTNTPEPLPFFLSKLIRPSIAPHTYLPGTCEYLRLRWSPKNSPPGTVVVPIMFHSIRASGKKIPAGDTTTISAELFQGFMSAAKYLGFETITTSQLNDFLRHNARIPSRSMILIVDDRRPGVIEDHFMPLLEANNWTVTLGWIVTDNTEAEWARMERLNSTGRLDIQSHGYLHRYITAETPEDQVREEIIKPIDILKQHFGQRPIAFIWPGGNFTPLSVEIARQAGYQLGFSIFSRGPLLFNWIPLGQEELAVSDPLMVLPRFWSTGGSVNLELGLNIGEQARADAMQNYDREAAYFHTYCGGELPPLSSIFSTVPPK